MFLFRFRWLFFTFVIAITAINPFTGFFLLLAAGLLLAPILPVFAALSPAIGNLVFAALTSPTLFLYSGALFITKRVFDRVVGNEKHAAILAAVVVLTAGFSLPFVFNRMSEAAELAWTRGEIAPDAPYVGPIRHVAIIAPQRGFNEENLDIMLNSDSDMFHCGAICQRLLMNGEAEEVSMTVLLGRDDGSGAFSVTMLRGGLSRIYRIERRASCPAPPGTGRFSGREFDGGRLAGDSQTPANPPGQSPTEQRIASGECIVWTDSLSHRRLPDFYIRSIEGKPPRPGAVRYRLEVGRIDQSGSPNILARTSATDRRLIGTPLLIGAFGRSLAPEIYTHLQTHPHGWSYNGYIDIGRVARDVLGDRLRQVR